MSDNKLKFEFDFEEMIDGIKLGVMKELTDITYDNIEKTVIQQVKAELLKRFDMDWSERLDLKREIKDDISKKVFITIKCDIENEIRSKQKKNFDEIINLISKDNEDYMEDLESKIIEKTVDELYSNLIQESQRQINKKIEQFTYKLMNNVGGDNVVVSNNSDKEKIITKEEYDELVQRDKLLAALEQGGVDNWEWYGESLLQYCREED